MNKKLSDIALKRARDDRTLFLLRKQAKCTHKKRAVRVLLFLRHPLLHLNLDCNTFLRAQLALDALLPARTVRELFMYSLLCLIATYPPSTGAFLLRCSHSLILIETVLLPRQFYIFISLEPFALTSPSSTYVPVYFSYSNATLIVSIFFFASIASHVITAIKIGVGARN